MPKNRLTSPASTRAGAGRPDVPFKAPRSNGAIRAIGPVTPKRIKPNGPPGVRYDKSTYINK